MSNNLRIMAMSDLHLRADKPIPRTDDFIGVQTKTLSAIRSACEENEVDIVLIAGDIFHRATVPDWLKVQLLLTFQGIPTYAVVGNHDVDFHNTNFVNKTSLGVVTAGETIISQLNRITIGAIIQGIHCDGSWKDMEDDADIVVAHQFVYKGKPPFPGADKTGRKARQLPSGPRLFITGDNHQRFITRKNGQTIINPGCATRQRSDMADHEPMVYLIDYDLDDDFLRVEEVPLPDNDPEAVSREHVEREEERDKRFQTLTDRLKTSESKSVSFQNNLEDKMKRTTLRKATKQEIATKLSNHIGAE